MLKRDNNQSDGSLDDLISFTSSINNDLQPPTKHKHQKKLKIPISILILTLIACLGAIFFINHTQTVNATKANFIVKRDFNPKTTDLTKHASLKDMDKLKKYAENLSDSDKRAYYLKLAEAGKQAVQDQQRYNYLIDANGKYSTRLTEKRLTRDMDILDGEDKMSDRLPAYSYRSYWRYMDLIGSTQVVDYLHQHTNALFTKKGKVKKNVSFQQIDQLLYYHSKYKKKFQQSADDYNRLTLARKVLVKRQKKLEKKRRKEEAKKRKEESIKESLKRAQESSKAAQDSIADAQNKQNANTKTSSATSMSSSNDSSPSSYTGNNNDDDNNDDDNAQSAEESSDDESSSSSYDSASMSKDISSILHNSRANQSLEQ